MDYIRQLVREAHRRSLWQVFGVYVALSWGVYQVIKELTDFVGLPDWVPGLGIALLLIGLPIVLATAFIQEGGPGRASAEPAPSIDPTLLPMSDATSSAERRALETAPTASRSHSLFTWQKAVLGGISAFLLLGITAGGYMGMRNAGVGPFGSLLASGEIDSRERILIAEFTPLNGDTMLASTVTEAFRVDFAQSPTVTVLQPKHVRTVLQRMSHDGNARVDAELAHEIAVRDNIKAYLVGELSQAGGKYLISGKLMATRDSRVLASYRETARNADDIIAAVDRLSKKLRNKIGDSFKTIRAEKPLELVSTPSFEALQKYTQGAYLIDVERDFDAGVALLLEAIQLDTAFAMAWRKLGVAYANSDGSEDKRRRAILKAYDFRDRLPDIERLNAEGMYFYSLKQDPERARTSYEMLSDRDPSWPPNNLGIVYQQLRQNEKARAAYQRAMQIDTTLTSSHVNLVDVFINMNMRDSAEHYTRTYAQRFGADRPEVLEKEFWIATAFRDFARADELLGPTPLEARSSLWRSRMNHTRADMALLRGQLRASRRHRELAIAADEARGNTIAQLEAHRWEAGFVFTAHRNPAQALQLLDETVRAYPLEQFPLLDRPYLALASNYAMLGQKERAQFYLAEYEKLVPAELRADDTVSRDFISGAIAMHEGRLDDAISSWRRVSVRGPCENCADWELALLFEQANQPDSAIARLEHYVNTPSSRIFWDDSFKLATAYERLADLYLARGDRQNAARYAGKFVNLWQDADPELQPRVRAKRELLRELN